MPRKNPRVDKADEHDLEVGKPKEWAAGMPGVCHSFSRRSSIWAWAGPEKRCWG